MADSALAPFTAASTLDGTELYYTVQGGADRKATGTQIKALVSASPTLVTPALGTPASGVMTNVTGTAAGLTAGNVTTNANLTGDVTSTGNATTLTNAPVIAKVLTGYTSGAGIVSAADSILAAIQKLNGNDATNANLTGPITSSGNATSIASQTGTGTKFVMDTSPTLVTPLLGTPTSGVLTNCTGTASGLTAGNVTTNASLTGVITSSGNATSIASQTGTGTKFVVDNTPTLITPVLGVATATSINGNTFTTGTYTLTGAAGKTFTFSNTLTLAGTDGTTMTLPPASASLGYLNVPQNSQSLAYTTVLADAGKHILHPSADTTARTFTIDSNANVPYILGTVLTFINQNAGGVITIAITTDTMRLAGAGTTGSRTLAANGMATAIKVATTEWLISGTGLT